MAEQHPGYLQRREEYHQEVDDYMHEMDKLSRWFPNFTTNELEVQLTGTGTAVKRLVDSTLPPRPPRLGSPFEYKPKRKGALPEADIGWEPFIYASATQSPILAGKRENPPPITMVHRVAAAKKATNYKLSPGRYPFGNARCDLADINNSLGLDVLGLGRMSLNAPNGGAYPNFLGESSARDGIGGGGQRQAPSPMNQQQVNNHNVTNGVGGGINGMGVGMPVNAGQQMDVNLVYQKLIELSEVLKENRERTQGIVAGAEELATRAASNGVNPTIEEANSEMSAARIADLTRQNNHLQHIKQILLREQRENTKLIGEYETAIGQVVEQIRNFAYSKNMEKHQLSRDYNKLLQDEKDAHLATRLEKDDWHAKFMRSVEMIRAAYALRCAEDETPTTIVAGLQNEVRAYRNALGMEPEKFEHEFGYEILKDVKNGAGEL